MRFRELMECFVQSKNKEENYKSCAKLAEKKDERETNIYAGLGQKNLKEKDYLKLVQKVLDGEVTLSVLQDMSQLKKEEKQSFLADIEDMVSSDMLHELNKKVMEYAIELSAPEDAAFLLRRGEDAIFRDLLYLEAKRNNSDASIDEKEILVIKLSSSILEHYHILIDSFYKKKFESTEILEKTNQELDTDSKFISIWNQEECYIKESIAHSIIVLFVSNIFRRDIFNKQTDPIKIQEFAKLDKDLNDPNSKYFKEFKNSEFIEDIANKISIQGEITITFETLS
ncbi:MAG TPA: DUF5410 domain-containing protein [Rickettsia endosymbiont of Pyrocoelia pectoralis]|nr:DUF5410 domain-containing protein [Rickettsia endosymbiont of Pyrocoelia pectoralis]